MIGILFTGLCIYFVWLIASSIARHEAKKAIKFKNKYL